MRHVREAEGQILNWQDDEIGPLYQKCLCKELELETKFR